MTGITAERSDMMFLSQLSSLICTHFGEKINRADWPCGQSRVGCAAYSSDGSLTNRGAVAP